MQGSADVQKSRLEGIDVARALALIGMLAVHFGPEDDQSLLGRLYAMPHGRASILFALVAGVGISLLGARRDNLTHAQVRLLGFALVLLPLGLTLEAMDHRVAVILHHYAAFFVLGAAFLPASRGTLLASAAFATVFGPLLYYTARASWPDALERESVVLLDGPLDIIQALLWSGPYPLLVWAAPILWGMWLGRQNFRDGKLLAVMLVAGALVAWGAVEFSHRMLGLLGEPSEVEDMRMLLSATAHSQMPLWLIQALAMAAAVLAASLLLARWLPKVLAPVARMGRMVLSLYVLHLLVLTAWPEILPRDDVASAMVAVGVYALFGMAVASVWPWQRGPLEALLHLVARWIAERVGVQRRSAEELQASR
jgi:uncharacterized membrane protein